MNTKPAFPVWGVIRTLFSLEGLFLAFRRTSNLWMYLTDPSDLLKAVCWSVGLVTGIASVAFLPFWMNVGLLPIGYVFVILTNEILSQKSYLQLSEDQRGPFSQVMERTALINSFLSGGWIALLVAIVFYSVSARFGIQAGNLALVVLMILALGENDRRKRQ